MPKRRNLRNGIAVLIEVPRVLNRETLRQGAEALAARDADLARILRRVGDPPLWGRRPGFPALVRIILEQQVSLQAARTMYRRLDAHLDGITPDTVHSLQVTGLREFGLTRQKAGYCHGLAARVLAGTLDLRAVARATDESGRSALLAVPGLGAWSVDIYFLMALRRPDVWPQGDLALASALRDVKRLRALPSTDEQRTYATRWAPWRSVAARILWSHYLTERGSSLR
jgi:DNA-3-methyladenine glycosylase II